jgi:hypothetical protein
MQGRPLHAGRSRSLRSQPARAPREGMALLAPDSAPPLELAAAELAAAPGLAPPAAAAAPLPRHGPLRTSCESGFCSRASPTIVRPASPRLCVPCDPPYPDLMWQVCQETEAARHGRRPRSDQPSERRGVRSVPPYEALCRLSFNTWPNTLGKHLPERHINNGSAPNN